MKILPNLIALALGTMLAAGMGGCGSSTPASVSAPPSASTSATSSTTTSVSPHATSSRSSTASATTSTTQTTASTTTSTSTSARSTTTATATTTRTETAPAFVGPNPTSDVAIGHDLAAAIAVLARAGYVPVRTSAYHAADTLRVLIGTRPGAGSPTERAFFFDQTIYLGTDARAASAQISVLSQSDTEATLGYAVHRRGTPNPRALRRVRFALDMGRLTALDPLPSAATRR